MVIFHIKYITITNGTKPVIRVFSRNDRASSL